MFSIILFSAPSCTATTSSCKTDYNYFYPLKKGQVLSKFLTVSYFIPQLHSKNPFSSGHFFPAVSTSIIQILTSFFFENNVSRASRCQLASTLRVDGIFFRLRENRDGRVYDRILSNILISVIEFDLLVLLILERTIALSIYETLDLDHGNS